MISGALVRYVLTAAVRDRLLAALALTALVGVSLAIFIGSSAVIEQDRFAVVFMAGGLRFILVAVLILFTVFFIRRSFDSKDIEFVLSRPVGRIEMLLSYSLAFSFLAVFCAALMGLILFALTGFRLHAGLFFWSVSLVVEAVVVVNTALFFSMVMSSAAGSALAAFGFYTLARMMGQLLGIAGSGKVEVLTFLNWMLQGVSMLTPRLDLMAQTGWLVYGPEGTPADVAFILLQATAFLFLILTAALIDFVRRQF